MKIQSSNVNLFSNSYDIEQTSLKRTLIRQNNNNQIDSIKGKIHQPLNQQIKEQLRQLKKETNKIESEELEIHLTEKDYQKMKFLEKILSGLIGKNVKFILPKKIKLQENNYNQKVNQILTRQQNSSRIIYQEDFTFHKESELSFKASGNVTTEDGRIINFDLKLKESREVDISRITRVDKGNLVDPLVLSFDGRLPSLTDEKYSFDIDFDGKEDQISFLTKGSGFLAFDKNEDGIINNGSELFGPESGSGFEDLAKYDQDNNGWIDENDNIFDKLRIWTKDAEGKDQLIALGEKGVGAIFLSSVAGQFDLLGSDFKKNGVVKESGIFLNEDGTVHNMHHVDIQL